jgi:hypothetical protein
VDFRFRGALGVGALSEFLDLWDLLSHVWRLASSGSAKSAYEGLFNEAIIFRPSEMAWKTWAPNNC